MTVLSGRLMAVIIRYIGDVFTFINDDDDGDGNGDDDDGGGEGDDGDGDYSGDDDDGDDDGDGGVNLLNETHLPERAFPDHFDRLEVVHAKPTSLQSAGK